MEVLIEILHDACPFLIAFSYLVELFFNVCRKVIIQDIGEVFGQEVIDYSADVRWQ